MGFLQEKASKMWPQFEIQLISAELFSSELCEIDLTSTFLNNRWDLFVETHLFLFLRSYFCTALIVKYFEIVPARDHFSQSVSLQLTCTNCYALLRTYRVQTHIPLWSCYWIITRSRIQNLPLLLKNWNQETF